MKIIAEESGLEQEKLKPEATLIDLDIGSIDLVSAVFSLEEEMGIEIDPEELSRDITLEQFVDHVMKLAKK